MTHINSISCGQGAPSVYLLLMAHQGIFPADVVIVADTGGENDMLWSTGERTTAREFFERVTKPLAEEFGFDVAFVRANDGNGQPLPDIMSVQRIADDGKFEIDLPLFGSQGGRLQQSCTSKWKKAAVRQELRRRGATTATTNLGLTMDELHRMKSNDVKWERLHWPMLLNEKTYRVECEQKLAAAGIPWIVRSQCDFCPHKNAFRWGMSSPKTLNEAAEFEASFNGEFFLSSKRIPLKMVLDAPVTGDLFEGCDQGYCFV